MQVLSQVLQEVVAKVLLHFKPWLPILALLAMLVFPAKEERPLLRGTVLHLCGRPTVTIGPGGRSEALSWTA